jgi:predicted metal-dependent RNase
MPHGLYDADALAYLAERAIDVAPNHRGELSIPVADTLKRGGKVIIPAFSVGRTQQIVYELNQCTLEKECPAAPIFVDSPLSTNATEVYRLHPECFNEEVYRSESETNTHNRAIVQLLKDCVTVCDPVLA